MKLNVRVQDLLRKDCQTIKNNKKDGKNKQYYLKRRKDHQKKVEFQGNHQIL